MVGTSESYPDVAWTAELRRLVLQAYGPSDVLPNPWELCWCTTCTAERAQTRPFRVAEESVPHEA